MNVGFKQTFSSSFGDLRGWSYTQCKTLQLGARKRRALAPFPFPFPRCQPRIWSLLVSNKFKMAVQTTNSYDISSAIDKACTTKLDTTPSGSSINPSDRTTFMDCQKFSQSLDGLLDVFTTDDSPNFDLNNDTASLDVKIGSQLNQSSVHLVNATTYGVGETNYSKIIVLSIIIFFTIFGNAVVVLSILLRRSCCTFCFHFPFLKPNPTFKDTYIKFL